MKAGHASAGNEGRGGKGKKSGQGMPVQGMRAGQAKAQKDMRAGAKTPCFLSAGHGMEMTLAASRAMLRRRDQSSC